MNFTFSEEQDELRSTIRKFLEAKARYLKGEPSDYVSPMVAESLPVLGAASVQ